MQSDDTRIDENLFSFTALTYFNFLVIDYHSGDAEELLYNFHCKKRLLLERTNMWQPCART
jgi:hypothetical protein